MPFSINQLQKPILRTYIPPQRSQPGHPGQPYQPAQWVTVRRRVCGWTVGGRLVGDAGGGLSLGGGGNTTVGLSNKQPRYVCVTESVRVFQPEQPYIAPRPPIPARPEQTIIDFQVGWNARAHSVIPMEGSGTFTFTVPADASGAIVGLCANPRDVGYNDINFGFYVANGVVRVYELGREIANFGAHPNAQLSITRYAGRILYRIGNDVVRDRPNFTAPAYLTAALYTGGDAVIDAALSDVAAAVGAFPGMSGYAGEDPPSQATGSLPAMTGTAGSYATGSASGSFPRMNGIAADSSGYAVSSGSFMPMTGFAESADLIPDYSVADGYMTPMTGFAQGVMHIVGSVEAEFPPMNGLSSELFYAQVVGSFRAMNGYADATEGTDEAMVFASWLNQDSITPQTVMFALVDSDMNLTAVFSVSSVGVASVESLLNLTDDYEVSQTLQALIASWMEASASAFDPASNQVRDVWVYHMSSDGSTRYEGFDFDGFAKVQDAYYGIKPDGIYLLEGPDDDGDDVESRVNFGSLSFGTMARKSLPYVYVGMASSGDTFLRVTAEGQTYTYRVRHSTEDMKTHRYELGRGLDANFYELELVGDGELFDLHAIEFMAVKLKRRL